MKSMSVIALTMVGVFVACGDRLPDTQSSSIGSHASAIQQAAGTGTHELNVGAELPASSCNILTVCGNYGPVRAGVFAVARVGPTGPDQTASLHLVDSWEGELPSDFDIRLDYSNVTTMPDGRKAALTEALATVKQGDSLGLVFGGSPSDGPCWGANTVFRKGENGGYTNGSMFTRAVWSLTEIGDLLRKNVAQLAADEPCSPNIGADNFPDQPAFDEAGVPGPSGSAEPLPNDFDPDEPQGPAPK